MWIEHAGHRIPTLDLFSAGFVLLVDRDDVGAIDTDVPLHTHAIPGSRWRQADGIEPGDAVLVRPDGHVVWRARHAVGDLAVGGHLGSSYLHGSQDSAAPARRLGLVVPGWVELEAAELFAGGSDPDVGVLSRVSAASGNVRAVDEVS